MESKTLQFGPWAVVTGANSGIGAAFAEELARQGYNVALVGRRAEALDAVSNRLRKTYSINTRSVVVDLSTPDFLAQLAEQTNDIDVGLLVSNAGDDAMGALLRVPCISNWCTISGGSSRSAVAAAYFWYHQQPPCKGHRSWPTTPAQRRTF
jgi:NADP-dependent 3-hydroxy acid dehydrogenase YdfG